MGLTTHQDAAAASDDAKVRDVRIQLSLQRWCAPAQRGLVDAVVGMNERTGGGLRGNANSKGVSSTRGGDQAEQ
jgi:hypothetical protein